jgi:PAS domain S-box-containing protein
MTVRAGRAEEPDIDLLVEAGVVLAESLDVPTTLGRVARLTIPRLADLCVIDLVDEDGAIVQTAAASVEETVAEDLRALRERRRLDPEGPHPVAEVIRSGRPVLLSQMESDELRSYAAGARHARFMIEHGYHSAVVAPLTARQRTLGALSVLRLGNDTAYEESDLAVVNELARRAALAIDNARLYSEVRRVEQRLAAILVSLAEAITLTDAEGCIVFANQAAADLLGAASPDKLIGSEQAALMARYFVRDEHGAELTAEQLPHRRMFAGEDPEPMLLHAIERTSGEERWLMARPAPVLDHESERLLFSVNVYEDITEVKRAETAESFMAEASRVLASSMDFPETLQKVARLAVPQIADWCAVDVLGENGEIEAVAIHHGDPAKLSQAQQLRRSGAASIEDEGGVAEVIRTGSARLYPAIDREALASEASEQHMRLMLSLRTTSAIVVPLAAPSRTVGALTLATSESVRRMSERDIPLAVRLGRRAGTAVESARLYTERKRIADVLQAALLPEELPPIPDAQVSALYRAAGELNDVGGDFYDVCPCSAGRWMLAIGDVCGKGPRAAGVTALARHTLRAGAMLDQTPTDILRTLHRALGHQPAGADMCTVCLVMIEPRGDAARLTVTLAGHPPPVIVRAGGKAAQVGAPGTLLGVVEDLQIKEVETQLCAGETLLLYTDGVLEAGAPDRPIGEHGLLELCSAQERLELAELLRRIEQTAVERTAGELHDDIAMLGVRVAAAEPRAGAEDVG